MPSYGFGGMFEGDFADMCAGGLSGGSSVRRPGSEDPHRLISWQLKYDCIPFNLNA